MQLGFQEVLRCGQAKSPSSSQLNARLFPCCAAARARRAACGLRGEHVRALRRGVPDDVGPGLPHEDAPLQEGGEGRSGAGGAGRWDRRGGEVSDILAHVVESTEWKMGHFIICIWVHIIVSKRNVSKQLLSNQNHAEPVGDMLLKSRR